MSIPVDRADREAAVIVAAWRIIARHGLGGLTVRAVAAEAGVPMSSMRYWFDGQHVVRERALIAVAVNMQARVRALPGRPTASRRWALSALSALLPLKPDGHLEAAAHLALTGAAVGDPTLDAAWREVDGTIRAVCSHALRAAGVSDDPGALDRLHAAVLGLSAQLVLRGPETPTGWARDALGHYLGGTT